MVIKRINPVSCAKIMGLLYSVIGLLVGSVAALATLVGRFVGSGSWANGPLAAFGIAAIFLFPILYGILGFVMTWIAAAIYNVLAGVVGGVQVEIASSPGSGWNPIGSTQITPM